MHASRHAERQSTSPNEVINLMPDEGEAFVTPGEYYVDVHGYNVPDRHRDLPALRLDGRRGPGQRRRSVAPSSVTAGTNDALTVNWQNLDAGLHLGLITHSDGSTVLDQTVIEVTAP